MKEIQLPSNKRFGIFFTFIFALLTLYFFYIEKLILLSCVFAFLSIIFLIISLIKDTLLLPLNKIWMRFGIILNFIVSPIILGIIFFCLFVPIGLFMKIFQRDELKLNKNKNDTYWIKRNVNHYKNDLKNQF